MVKIRLVAMLALALGGATGCTSCEGPPRTVPGALVGTCTEGHAGCACKSDLTCDDGATCDHGFCMPTGCERGTEGCGCGTNGECQTTGLGLTCANGVCRAVDAPAPGTLGGECGDTQACGVADGEQLACTGGICQKPSCPTGQVGCPCGPYGRCGLVETNTLWCFDGLCSRGRCEAPATVGCLCSTDGDCASGHRCADSICRNGGASSVSVGNPDARACDVLLVETQAGRAPNVRFAPGVRGEQVYRSKKLALSFIAASDQPLPDPAVTIEAQSGSVAAYAVALSECADRAGQQVASPGVLLR